MDFDVGFYLFDFVGWDGGVVVVDEVGVVEEGDVVGVVGCVVGVVGE